MTSSSVLGVLDQTASVCLGSDSSFLEKCPIRNPSRGECTVRVVDWGEVQTHAVDECRDRVRATGQKPFADSEFDFVATDSEEQVGGGARSDGCAFTARGIDSTRQQSV